MKSLGGHKCRWEDNIKTYLTKNLWCAESLLRGGGVVPPWTAESKGGKMNILYEKCILCAQQGLNY